MRRDFFSKGSILIWAVFLGLFIALFFVTFQLRLGRFSEQSQQNIRNSEKASALQDSLSVLKSNPQVNIPISDSESLESLEFEGNSYVAFLRQNESRKYMINTSPVTNIPLTILEGGPIYYEVKTGGTTTSSGTLLSSGLISINSGGSAQEVTLENIGGYARIRIEKGGSDLRADTVLYRHTKSIADQTQVLGVYER